MANVIMPQSVFARIARLNGNQTIPSPCLLTVANANTFTVSTKPPLGITDPPPSVLLLDTDVGLGIPFNLSRVDAAGNLWVVSIAANLLTAGHHYLLRVVNNFATPQIGRKRQILAKSISGRSGHPFPSGACEREWQHTLGELVGETFGYHLLQRRRLSNREVCRANKATPLTGP